MLVAQIAYFVGVAQLGVGVAFTQLFVGVAQLGVGVASEQEIPDGK